MGNTIINIANEIGTQNAILHKFGLQIKEIVLREYHSGNRVTLDFSDLNNATTGFFHASIGNLYRELREQFDSIVTVKGLHRNETWKEKFQDAINLVKNPDRMTEIDKSISELFD